MTWFEQFLLWVLTPVLALTLALCFVRLLRGPSLPDRVVAIDMLSVVGIGMMAAFAVATGQMIFLDVAIIVALISFLGSVGFAYYVFRRRRAAVYDRPNP